MTNEEAISIINQYDVNFYRTDGEPISADKLAEAFDLAIEALRKQDATDTNVGDTVYKKDVLYALKKCRTQCCREDKMGDKWIHYETAQNEIECVQPVRIQANAGDTVSRKAVIRMFNIADRYVAESLKLCDTDKTFPQNEVFIVDDMYESLEQLPSAEPERKWIPCSDRLPEVKPEGEIEFSGRSQLEMLDSTFSISEPVEVTCKTEAGYKVTIAQWEVDGESCRYWVNDYGGFVDGVIAWRPLPEPYKEAEHDEP